MNDGFINEDLLRDYINANRYSEYNANIRSLLQFLFGRDLNPELPFSANKPAGQIKPDLSITHNGVEKYISIKKGTGNSVHQEKIEVFFPFFENLLGTDALNDLKIFHYGDDTIDDSGAIRYNASECKSRYSRQISNLNTLINTEQNLVQFLNRFLFTGNVGEISADAIYYGTIDSGLWASKEEIIAYICNNEFPINAIHFGPLTYQVWGRNENRTAVHSDRRYVMQVKWSSIASDLKSIRDKA